jgi:hypothetical protein
MWRVANTKIDFLDPWCQFRPGQGEIFLQEMARELSPGHLLEGLALVPLGHSGAADEALFGADDGRVFQVHLTLSQHTEHPPLPRWQIFFRCGRLNSIGDVACERRISGLKAARFLTCFLPAGICEPEPNLTVIPQRSLAPHDGYAGFRQLHILLNTR